MEAPMEDTGIPSAEGISNTDVEVVESVDSSADLKVEKVDKVIEHEDGEDEFDLVSH
jgi:hypothetical protein